MKIETGLEKKFIETTPLPSFGNSWAFDPPPTPPPPPRISNAFCGGGGVWIFSGTTQ